MRLCMISLCHTCLNCPCFLMKLFPNMLRLTFIDQFSSQTPSHLSPLFFILVLSFLLFLLPPTRTRLHHLYVHLFMYLSKLYTLLPYHTPPYPLQLNFVTLTLSTFPYRVLLSLHYSCLPTYPAYPAYPSNTAYPAYSAYPV